MKFKQRWWFILLALLTVAQLSVMHVYFADQRYLTNLSDRIVSSELLPSEQVKEMLAFLRETLVLTNNSYFLLPLFSFLRPTARQVAEQGGDCADRSRLLITLLRLRGIKASKWALYSSDGIPLHAAVEVEVESRKMVVDALYGLWFPSPQGDYYGIKELKADPSILRERIRNLLKQGKQPGPLRLQGYPLNEYVYENAKTINWDKSIVMQWFYKILHWIMGESVNTIPRPAFVEQPASMVVLGLICLELCIIAAWLLSNRWGNRRKVWDMMDEQKLAA